MDKVSIEITETEYLIKLRKTDYDLSFLYTLLNRIHHIRHRISGDNAFDIMDKPAGRHADDPGDRFDHLADK